MRRFNTRSVLIALSFSLLLFLAVIFKNTNSTFSAELGESAQGKPNFVIILTDDMDYRLVDYMPNVKRLIKKKGLSFENFIVTNSICCPSRATLLRGQYSHNHQVFTNLAESGGGFEKFYKLGEESSTLPVWLSSAGYRTALFGKYLNGYTENTVPQTYIPPGWTRWFSIVGGSLIKYYDYNVNDQGKVVYYGNDPSDYKTDVISKKAVNFIKDSKKNSSPFFLYVAPVAPHLPATPAERHKNLYKGEKLSEKPSFNEEDISDKPSWMGSLTLMEKEKVDQINFYYKNRLRSLRSVDEMVRKIYKALSATGKLSSTYIVFTSDNGFLMGEHRIRIGKGVPYEESIKAPFIISGPGIPANTNSDEMAGNIDIAPTISDLAGAASADFVDGISLKETLFNPAGTPQASRQAILLEHYSGEAPESLEEAEYRVSIPGYFGVRTRDFTYVEYSTGEREYYDLRSDPFQLNNSYPFIDQNQKDYLSDLVEKLKACKGSLECSPADDTLQ